MSLGEVNKGKWCPYCRERGYKICDDNACDFCFRKSFASFKIDRVQSWSTENDKTPRQVLRGTLDKYLFDCQECHSTFSMRVRNVVCYDSWCPRCASSKMEKYAAEALEELGLSFRPQFRFREQSNGGYDFAVLDDNEDPLWLLETDGIQHFFGGTFGSTTFTKEEELARNIRQDKKKDDLAMKRRVPLLRIPYSRGKTPAEIKGWIEHFVSELKRVKGLMIMRVDSKLYKMVLHGSK
jgi:hypothetical protein